jgi:histidinol-phosphate aminotransferase
VTLPGRRSAPAASHPHGANRDAEPIRLDRLTNPYGASPLVAETLAAGDGTGLDPGVLRRRLDRRLASLAGVPEGWVRSANGIDDALRQALAGAGDSPLLLLPPADDPAPVLEAARSGRPAVEVWRAASFRPDLDAETAAELPAGTVAVVTSPHDPSGSLLPVQDAVRLARACAWLFIDERCGGFGPRSFATLAREFDNVVVFQTLETWAGLASFPVGWAVASPRTLDRLFGESGRAVSAGSALAGIATLDDLPAVLASVRRVRDERSRLYRMLRKLNMVQPLPSWAGFVLARATRSSGDDLAAALRERGVLVHRPAAPGLEDVLRIAAGRPADTDTLRGALIEAGLEL